VPLHYLVAYASYTTNRHDTDNRVACIHLLAAAGANMSLLTIHNTTAIMYAARGGNPTVLAALLDAGSEVTHTCQKSTIAKTILRRLGEPARAIEVATPCN
jgi:hypothetical protein